MRKELNDIALKEATTFLEEKLSSHSDRIPVEQFRYLYEIDKNCQLITNALEYAKDCNIDIDDVHGVDALVELVGKKIDLLQEEYDLKVTSYRREKKEQIEIMLRDLQIVHFGLIGLLLDKKYVTRIKHV